MVWKRRPFKVVLSLGNSKKSAGAKSEEQGGWGTTTNAHSETGQMEVCCQNLTLGVLSNCSALSVLFGALFKKFSLFLNTPRI